MTIGDTRTDHDGKQFRCYDEHFLEYRDAATNSNKFWNCTLEGNVTPKQTPEERAKSWYVTLRWGRIGTVGQEVVKTFTSQHKASAYVSDRFRDKTGKGYVPATAIPRVPLKPAPASVPVIETEWDLL